MKFLVTGGAGFIGSHIVGELVERKEEVRVLDNFVTGKRENLSEFLNTIELIEGDVRDLETVRTATRGADFVIHEAALRSVPKSIKDPLNYNQVNITGTLNVLMASHEAKVKRVVFASSSSVYGDTDILPEQEDHPPKLISPYAATKLAGEYWCRVFAKSYGLSTVSLRYFNVFGPKQSLESEYAVVVPKFIMCMLKDEPPPVHGNGLQSRDFTYVDNVIEATLKAAQTNGVSDGEVINVACGKAYTVLEIVKYLNGILGKNIEPKFTPPRPGDVRHTLADTHKVRRLLGCKRFIDFEEGLKRTAGWFGRTM